MDGRCPLAGKKILITYGPTWVALDDVRFISNSSTGELGQLLAKGLCKKKADVTVLEGPVPRPLKSLKIKSVSYAFFSELGAKLKGILKKRKVDIVIHAAAVADYRPQKPTPGKIPSGRRHLTISFVPTEKLIDKIKKWSPASFLVGFKLEPSFDQRHMTRKAEKLILRARCDMVVANALHPAYQAAIFDSHGCFLARARSRGQLAKKLIAALEANI